MIDPEIARRVAALEQRLGQVDTHSRAAVGNADRAEGLLVAFAARRALDRGVALGFLEALLQPALRRQPAAGGGHDHHRRAPAGDPQELQGGLEQAGPAADRRGARPELVGRVPQRARQPDHRPPRRHALARAEPSGWRGRSAGSKPARSSAALAEVLRMPGREHGADWVVEGAALRARPPGARPIETAALLEPQRQPAPTAAAPSSAGASRAPAPAAPHGRRARAQPQPRYSRSRSQATTARSRCGFSARGAAPAAADAIRVRVKTEVGIGRHDAADAAAAVGERAPAPRNGSARPGSSAAAPR